MNTITLNDDDLSSVINALVLARDRYQANAIAMRRPPAEQGLAEQFERQVEDAKRLIEALQDAEAAPEPGGRLGYQAAVAKLREARDLLAGAPRAQNKVRRAIASAEGAIRHADSLEDRRIVSLANALYDAYGPENT